MNANVTELKTRTNRLDALAEALLEAKKKENDARTLRTAIEEEILAIVGAKLEGSLSIDTDRFHITTTGRITRTLDAVKVKTLDLPKPLLDRLFSWEPKLNLRECRYVEENEDHHWARLSQAITTKPAKASVAVKEI